MLDPCGGKGSICKQEALRWWGVVYGWKGANQNRWKEHGYLPKRQGRGGGGTSSAVSVTPPYNQGLSRMWHYQCCPLPVSFFLMASLELA